MGNNAVSANHASFFTAQGGWAVIDHNSTNGVYVNNVRIVHPQYLKVGDVIRIANLHFFYYEHNLLMQTSAEEGAPVCPVCGKKQEVETPLRA